MQGLADKLKFALLRVMRLLLLALVVVYILICVAYTVFQRRLIYVPPHFTAEQVDTLAKQAGLERWTNLSGQAIGMKRMSPNGAATGRVLVVYGQGGWTVGCAHYADDIQSVAPLDVFLLEYPGYADRPGSPNEQHFFQAADEALQLLDHTNQPLYVIGESLGTGVAAYLAGAHPDKVAGVVLLSPYNRLTDVAQYRKPFLPAWLCLLDRFPAEDYLRNYRGPVGIVLDGYDDVIPERFGQRLFDGYTGPKHLWRFERGPHIFIPEPRSKFWQEAVEFWKKN